MEKTIMLCCAAGMSTSMLVAKMEDAAKADGIEAKIFACPASEADEKIAQENVSVVLLGPQVSYLLSSFKEKLADKNIPVEVINMQAYGMMDGEKVLHQGLDLAK
ncbi:MAG: PTS sugar transporter subunit IIB [Lactobacillus sp.]|nr:PTS sugar transporter subunit IIB [Lactobacillus sp.]